MRYDIYLDGIWMLEEPLLESSFLYMQSEDNCIQHKEGECRVNVVLYVEDFNVCFTL